MGSAEVMKGLGSLGEVMLGRKENTSDRAIRV